LISFAAGCRGKCGKPYRKPLISLRAVCGACVPYYYVIGLALPLRGRAALSPG